MCSSLMSWPSYDRKVIFYTTMHVYIYRSPLVLFIRNDQVQRRPSSTAVCVKSSIYCILLKQGRLWGREGAGSKMIVIITQRWISINRRSRGVVYNTERERERMWKLFETDCLHTAWIGFGFVCVLIVL